jgi:hypothetical protein
MSTRRSLPASRAGAGILPVLLVILAVLSCAWLRASADEMLQPTLFARVLALQHIQEPEMDDQAMTSAFAALLVSARLALAPALTVPDQIDALNRTLLLERSVTYLSNQYWRDSTLAASLLRHHGNCLATATLYVLVAEALRLPIHLVVIPGHAFVRWDQVAVHRNIETTAMGREISDDEYLYRREHCDPADVQGLGWGASLDADGFLAELVEAAVRHRVGENRLEEAAILEQEVERLAPGRSDLALLHIQLRSDLSKDRATTRAALADLLAHGRLPPTVATGALTMLAEDAASRQDFQGQRTLLLKALVAAPKTAMEQVLCSLAFCHRSLRDYHGARRYMELAVTLVPAGSPELAGQLYNLAICQKNDDDIESALSTLVIAKRLNPESWNVQMLEAGYLVLSGQREEGLSRRAAIAPPRDNLEFWLIMKAWFLAVCGEREQFLDAFEAALVASNSQRILVWIDQDVDLDPYRGDGRFQTLVEHHRQRLGADQAPAPQP